MSHSWKALSTLVAVAVFGLSGHCDCRAADSTHHLRPVVVVAPRAADIGVAAVTIDSAALRDNIAMSMADVLGLNSSIFVKNYGRATLSTASFRGTSASHTAVTWNGMPIESPMVGTVDFSMIPSFFVDDAKLVEGASTVTDVSGGLGGLVKLSTDVRKVSDGFSGQYTQGIGSWRTFDEFLRLAYSRNRWRISARVSYSSSANDFPFTNRDKKENVYDENHNIVSSFYPRERNRSGAFRDFNALGSASYDSPVGQWEINTWYLSSNRELPVLTTDYSNSFEFDNRQREQTVRTVASWQKFNARHSLSARAGYVHTWIAYDYWRQISQDAVSVMTRARSRVNSLYGNFTWRCFLSPKWFFSVTADINHHSVGSYDYAKTAEAGSGYSARRAELSAAGQAKWRPSSRWGLGAVVRQEMHGTHLSAPIPAIFADGVLWPKIALTGRVSASRNYRYPTLNDLFTVPGGNPALRPERGMSYDARLSSAIRIGAIAQTNLSATWFDSRIDDWIMWLPSPRGFYEPSNARRVHSYGTEAAASSEIDFPDGWHLAVSLNYAYTASINLSEPLSASDQSYGKQLPYIPRHSASASLRLGWRGWTLAYRMQAYSERFTMTSNEPTLSGRLPAYSVSNLSLEKFFELWHLRWNAKITVNNLFNADYQTVLSRPMPGINFEAFLSIAW